MNVVELKSNEKQFRALCGVSVNHFNRLLVYYARVEGAFLQHKTFRGYQRSKYSYRNPRTPLSGPEERLFFGLYDLKNNPLQEALGASFGMSQPAANMLLKFTRPRLKEALDAAGALPSRDHQLSEALLAFQRLPDPRDAPGVEKTELVDAPGAGKTELILDATERPVGRPVDPTEQTRLYSGKKKRHTLKNAALVSMTTALILWLSPTFEGKKHDKAVMDASNVRFPAGARLFQDLGFIGYAPKGVEIKQPHKKPAGEELTATQKGENRAISKKECS